MSNTPLISIIIPAYNASTYIGQCIENIKFQTYKNVEIIVVDDGSSDDTADIAKSYNVKVICQANHGVSAARNKGLNKAVGEYIHFMDVDDLINNCFYEELIKASLLSGADVACCGVIHENNDTRTHIFEGNFLVLNLDDKMVMSRVGEDGYCFKYLFRKDFLLSKSLTFDESLSIREDVVFSLQAVYWANQIVCVREALYYYKQRCTSALNKFNRTRKANRKKQMLPVERFMKKFQENYHLKSIGLDRGVSKVYRVFGLGLVKKKTMKNGVVKWYLLGICIVQTKIY